MDDEKLILLVQERNILYNKYNPYFKIVERKQEAWIDIGKEMDTTAEDCMRRWTCIRDRYSREIKRVEQSSDSNSEVLWPYYDMMAFIRPFITSRPIRGSKFRRLGRKMCFEPINSSTPSFVSKQPAITSPTPTHSIEKKYSTVLSPTHSTRASPVECREFTHIYDDPLNEAPLPRKESMKSNTDVDQSFCDAVEALKKACALNEARHANPAVHAFGEMIVSTICSMNSRNQLKAMQQVTDTVMGIKLEEDELLDQVSYSTL